MEISYPILQNGRDFSIATLGAPGRWLRFKDHYAAMDASRDASVAELRRAYLKASVPRGPKFGLGGGFTCFLFSPLLGEMIQFD